MMKYILLIALLFSILIGYSQNDTTKYYTSTDYGWKWNRGMFKKALIPPTDTVSNKLGLSLIGRHIYAGDGTKWVDTYITIDTTHFLHQSDISGFATTSSVNSALSFKLNVNDTSGKWLGSWWSSIISPKWDSAVAKYYLSANYQPKGNYILSESDPIYSASSWISTTNNSNNWNTAFSWGNHATAGYVPSARTINGYDLRSNIILNTSDIGEGTNLYFTNTRSRTAISLTTTGSSGAATYNTTTGVINIPAYTLSGLGGISLSSLSATSPLSYNNTTGAFSISQATTTSNGYLSSTDWNTFNGKQNALGFTPYNATNPANYISLNGISSSATGLTYTNTTGVFSLTSGYVIPTTIEETNWNSAYTNRITSLTTTGSSGAATLVSNVLNIPTYTLAGLGGQSQLNGTGLVRMSGTSVSYDNNTYLTGNQSITFTSSGDITGSASGTTSLSPSLSLATITQSSLGSFVKVTLDTKGRVIGNTAVTTSDLTSLLGGTYGNLTATQTWTGVNTFAIPTLGTVAVFNGQNNRSLTISSNTANVTMAVGGTNPVSFSMTSAGDINITQGSGSIVNLGSGAGNLNLFNNAAKTPSGVANAYNSGIEIPTGGGTGYSLVFKNNNSTSLINAFEFYVPNTTISTNSSYSFMKMYNSSYTFFNIDGWGTTTIGPSAITKASWGTSGVNLQTPTATYTDNSATGTVTNAYINTFGVPTIAATNARTITTAATVYIAGAPTAGTNTTLTNKWALHVGANDVRFEGNLFMAGGVNTNGNITINSSGAVFQNLGSSAGSGFRLDNSYLGLFNSSTTVAYLGNSTSALCVNTSNQVSIGSSTMVASALFSLNSTTQGALLPRMTTTQINAITSPAEGLKAYDLTLHSDKFYNGTSWDTYGSLAATQTWTGINTFTGKIGGNIFMNSVSYGYYTTDANAGMDFSHGTSLRQYGGIYSFWNTQASRYELYTGGNSSTNHAISLNVAAGLVRGQESNDWDVSTASTLLAGGINGKDLIVRGGNSTQSGQATSSSGNLLLQGGYSINSNTAITNGYISFSTVPDGSFGSGNLVERLRVKQSGQVKFVPMASAPSSPEEGDTYYNSTTHKLYTYDGTTWQAAW